MIVKRDEPTDGLARLFDRHASVEPDLLLLERSDHALDVRVLLRTPDGKRLLKADSRAASHSFVRQRMDSFQPTVSRVKQTITTISQTGIRPSGITSVIHIPALVGLESLLRR